MNHLIRVLSRRHDDYSWVRINRLRCPVGSPVVGRLGLEISQDHVQAAQRCGLSRGVLVQRHGHLAGQASDLIDLEFSQRRPHLGHDVFEPGLMSCDGVHIAFYDHGAFFPHISPGPVHGIEQTALIEQRPLRRVQVLGLRTV